MEKAKLQNPTNVNGFIDTFSGDPKRQAFDKKHPQYRARDLTPPPLESPEKSKLQNTNGTGMQFTSQYDLNKVRDKSKEIRDT